MSEVIAKKVPKVKLSDDKFIPAIGLGTQGLLYNRQAKLMRRFNNDQKSSETIIEALKSGYRHLDSAYFFNVEHAIDIALGHLQTKKLIKRSDLFISTKIWNTFHRRDRVLKGLKLSLTDMGLEYVDLAVLHYPMGFQDGAEVWPTYSNGSNIPRSWDKDDYTEAWLGIEKAQRLGIARSIGVANFNVEQLKLLMSRASIKPVVHQIESNPTFQQNDMVAFCKANNIQVMAYAPLRGGDYQVCENKVLESIGKKFGKTAAQVALRWNYQRGVIPLPKAAKKKHQDENIDIFNKEFVISSEDMALIKGIPQLPSGKFRDI
ncbi:unnamed protein product, partial [Oppiella nova]